MYYYAFNLPRPEGSRAGAGAPSALGLAEQGSWAQANRRARLAAGAGGGGLSCAVTRATVLSQGRPRQAMSGRRRIAEVGLAN